MTDVEGDLRATVDDVHEDARRLADIEAEKARLAADDPRMLELSEEAERLGRALMRKTVAQRELAEEVAQEATDAVAESPSAAADSPSGLDTPLARDVRTAAADI